MSPSRHIVTCASLLYIAVTLSCFVVSYSNVINDVNNMLRDATTAETDTDTDTLSIDTLNVVAGGDGGLENRERVGATVALSSAQQMLRNGNSNSNGNGKRRKKKYLKNNHNFDVVARNGNDVDVDVDVSNNDFDDEDSAGETSVELLRFVNDDDNNKNKEWHQRGVLTTAATILPVIGSDADVDGDGDDSEISTNADTSSLSLEDQVRLLTKQLNALMTRRREDYELLEHNLRKSLRITTNAETVDLDIRNELEQLRMEVKTLRDNQLSKNNNNKERLTIEWLQQSVAELRKQLSELQQMANSAVKDLGQRKESYEDLATIRNDFQQLKLELIALREREEQTEVYVRELREEILQQEEDYKRLLHNLHGKYENRNGNGKVYERTNSDEIVVDENGNENGNGNELTTESTADHRRRHCRFQSQQIHELQLSQRRMKHQLDELKFHRIDERVRNIEIEQHRIADANFNLSRQIASLDKLHSSMLELLEDVEGLQNKMDKNLPELRHEISKLEFSNAQLNSEQNLVREEGKNMARSLQAMAVSVSTLQDERESVKQMQNTVAQLRTNVDRLESMLQDVQRAMSHHRKLQQHASSKTNHSQHHRHTIATNVNSNSNTNEETKEKFINNADSVNNGNENEKLPTQQTYDYAPMTQRAESLVAKLENVEQQYESIINKLPQDCSEVSNVGGVDGLYLIAPAGQHRPMMVHCTADGWTTVQRRYDGSADFNRSWEDYASGFGAPIGEYWIGNEQLHHLTLSNCTSLRVIMQDIYDNTWLAEYTSFYISSRSDGYRLHVGGYHGNASDALDYQQGMQFSAIDVDRDISQTHCAANYEGGWWFSHCQHANLNGRYNLGLTWFDASRNEWIAVKSSQMLIKRHQTTTTGTESCSSILEKSSVTSGVTSATTILSSKATTSQQQQQQPTQTITTISNV